MKCDVCRDFELGSTIFLNAFVWYFFLRKPPITSVVVILKYKVALISNSFYFSRLGSFFWTDDASNLAPSLHHLQYRNIRFLLHFANQYSFFEQMTRCLKPASAVSSKEFPPNFIQNLLPSRKNCRNLTLRRGDLLPEVLNFSHNNSQYQKRTWHSAIKWIFVSVELDFLMLLPNTIDSTALVDYFPEIVINTIRYSAVALAKDERYFLAFFSMVGLA
jgi:hypothetical protein